MKRVHLPREQEGPQQEDLPAESFTSEVTEEEFGNLEFELACKAISTPMPIPLQPFRPPPLFPMELSGRLLTAEHDNGCTDAILDHGWVCQEGIPYDAVDLPDAKLVDGKKSSLFGITKPLRVRTGEHDFTYRMYVGTIDGPAPILVGRGLAERIGIRIEGLPTQIDGITTTTEEPTNMRSKLLPYQLTSADDAPDTFFSHGRAKERDYPVRLQGYDPSEDSWEPASNSNDQDALKRRLNTSGGGGKGKKKATPTAPTAPRTRKK